LVVLPILITIESKQDFKEKIVFNTDTVRKDVYRDREEDEL